MIARRLTTASLSGSHHHDDAQPSRSRASLDRLSWDNLRLFLAVAEAGSFRSAAQLAAVSINTIRTKVERLERQIGAPLVRRSVEGVALTQDGRELLQIARDMRELGRSAERVRDGYAATRGARVRIAATDGLGTFWLLPRLIDRQAESRDLDIELNCEVRTSEILFRDVDIAIQLEPPHCPELVAERIGTLHLLPYASDAYLRKFGVPKSMAEAAGHRLVWQQSELVPADIAPLFIDGAARDAMIAVQTNTSTAHFWAVAKGAGIGFLPSYVAAVTRNVRPIDINVALRREIYLVYHEAGPQSAAVGHALAWVRAAFDNAAYPWFAENFVHPDSFEGARGDSDGVIVNLFDEVLSAR